MTEAKALAEKIAGICSVNWMKAKEIESLLAEVDTSTRNACYDRAAEVAAGFDCSDDHFKCTDPDCECVRSIVAAIRRLKGGL